MGTHLGSSLAPSSVAWLYFIVSGSSRSVPVPPIVVSYIAYGSHCRSAKITMRKPSGHGGAPLSSPAQPRGCNRIWEQLTNNCNLWRSSPFPSYHHLSSTICALDLALDKQAVSFGPWWHRELATNAILRLLRFISHVVSLISTILSPSWTLGDSTFQSLSSSVHLTTWP